jgi:hypothetical protein
MSKLCGEMPLKDASPEPSAMTRIHFHALTWDAIYDSIGQRSWSGLPKKKLIQREEKDAIEKNA